MRFPLIPPLCLCLFVCGIFSPGKGQEQTPPNIVLIMADDLGYAELGSYGQKKIKTPYLDQLAEEGMSFAQHYTSAPVCAPARCSLMTGQHGGHAFVRDNYEVGPWESHKGQLPLKAKHVTIAEILQKKGYRTGAFGKWGLGRVGSSGDPLKQGFDRFFGYNCQRHAHNLFPKYLIDDAEERVLEGNDRGLTGQKYAPKEIAEEMLKFVEANKEGPFFLYYPTVIPHLPLQVPEEDLAQYKGQWEETAYNGKSYLPHPTPRSAYAAMITFMDTQIGRLMKKLKDLKIDDNTIVLFTSDNGTTFLKDQVDYEFFESVGKLKGLKGSVYEGGIRVPLIVRWPGMIEANSSSDHISAHYDTLITLAEVAGAPVDVKHDGISYLPTLIGGEQKQHDYLFWDFAGYGGQLAMRKGDWKAVKRDLKKNPQAKTEIYHLASDPGETKNLAAEQSAKVIEFEQLMLKAREEPEMLKFRFGKYE